MIRILIVEDNEYKSNITLSIALENGLNTENIAISDNVNEAISLLKQNAYSILVLDLNLPIRKRGKNKQDAGVTLLKMLEAGDLNVPRCVIGVTSYSALSDKYASYFQSMDFNLFDSEASDIWEIALDNKIKWFKKEQFSENKKSPKKVIVTVHGIRTAGVWQSELEKSIVVRDPSIQSTPYEFNNISSFKLLNPLSRRKIAKNFTGQLKELMLKHPESEFYIFSHSFGTYLLSRALESLTPENTPKIKYVVLAGSVLKRTYQWHKLKKKLSIGYVVNDCGIDDKVLLLSELFALGLGMAGRVGFDTFKDGSVVNRQYLGGHSFFEANKNFYENYWLPLILRL